MRAKGFCPKPSACEHFLQFVLVGLDDFRLELLQFNQPASDFSAPHPDFDALAKRYWQRVYAIYDQLEEHVDPRPRHAVNRLVETFRKTTAPMGRVPGKWSE